MFKVAIVDDNLDFLTQEKDLIKSYLDEQMLEYEIYTFNSSVEFECRIDNGKDSGYYDLYLLDIEMPGTSGLELAQNIRCKFPDQYIIFVTAHKGYSIEGYKHRAFYYVVKSDLTKMLMEAMKLTIEEKKEKVEPYYVIESPEYYQKIYYNDIYYIDVNKKYVYFHTKETKKTKDVPFSVRDSLKNVYKELNDPESFIYVDQNCLVNLKHVMRIDVEKQSVIMRDGSEIWINKSRRKTVERAILDYWRNRR